VGKISDVHSGFTKYGKPYVFVNFADWRRDGFKLTIWSEGLDSFADAPGPGWVGRWVSVVGLVDEPYENPSRNTSQVSITVQDSSQLRFVGAEEAAYRLGKAVSPGAAAPARSSPRPGTAGTEAPREPARPSNEELLARLAGASATSRNAPSGPGAPPAGSRSAPAARPSPPPVPAGGSSAGKRFLGWLALAGIGLLMVRACGGF
jgi:hypothetical protein